MEDDQPRNELVNLSKYSPKHKHLILANSKIMLQVKVKICPL